ncbi:MAG TPA: hypothetical protein VML54_13370, partial [Candidatus Limnocylindrales bacterium]|nr:hypothetical protein [Candidatus Limnocylindrales bacterium]
MAWPHRTLVLALALLHVAVLAPAVSRSYPSDDTLLLIPLLLSQLDGQSAWSALGYLFAPNQPDMPRAAWKLYVIASQFLFGPSNAGLLWVGVALHAISSVLVGALARRIGAAPRAAWLAAGLHFTAYPGFHAYLWPVGVQHVLTVLGVLLFLNVYLITEARRRSGQPYRGWWCLATVCGIVSSLGRASSLVGPVTVLTHAVLHARGREERLAAFARWRMPVLLSTIYPMALLAYFGDLQAFFVVPKLLDAQEILAPRVGDAAIFGLALAGVLLVVLLAGLVLDRAAGWPARLAERPRLRAALWAGAALFAVVPLIRIAAVYVSSVEALLAPLWLALNSANTVRWHLTSFPGSALGVAAGAALLFAVLSRPRPGRDALVLVPLFAALGLALFSMELRPSRYWIYVTPVLAIVLAMAMDRLADRLGAPTDRRPTWRHAALALACGVI